MSSGFGVGAASLCEGEGSSLFAFAAFRLGLLRALKQSRRSLLICMARQRATSSIVAARVIEGLAIKGRALETIAMLANVASDLKVMRFNTSHFRSARRWLGFSCLGELAHTYDWARRNSKQSIKLRFSGSAVLSVVAAECHSSGDGHHSAEEIGLQSPYRPDGATAQPARLFPDKR
jgi:hypothetical protein